MKRECLTSESVMTNNLKQSYEQIYKYLCMILENLNGNYQYYFDILKVFDGFPFTSSIKDKFIDQILEIYGTESYVWDSLAQREFLGLHYKPVSGVASTTEIKKNLCIAKYEEGLTKVMGDQKQALWSNYLNHLTKTSIHYENCFRQDFNETLYLNSKFEQANTEGHLTEEGFGWWLELNEFNCRLEFYGIDGSNTSIIERFKKLDVLKFKKEREILDKGKQ